MSIKAPPSRPCVLVLKDNAIVGFDLTQTLEAAGYEAAGPLGTCAEALAWLEADTPEAAILDLTLKDGFCVALAHVLRARGVPYVVLSANHHQDAPDELQGTPWFVKPVGPHNLLAALAVLQEMAA
jgi:DNA-binding response OmpR family regulator